MSLGYDNIQIYPYVMVDLEQLTLTKKSTSIPGSILQESSPRRCRTAMWKRLKEHRHRGEPAG